MTARFFALVSLVASLALAPSPSAASPTASFRVRPDPRMCPSPRCGGFWVAQVNRATTTCGDGSARAWCYVAGISFSGPATSRASMLVRGRIVRVANNDRLIATKAWLAATTAPWSGAVLLVNDTGIRCVRAPCFSFRTATVNTVRTATASGLNLSAVSAPAALTRRATAALAGTGLLLAGTVRREADGGRTIVATQFFLAAS